MVSEKTMSLGSAKLTKWKKEPSLQDLKSDLDMSKSAHNSHIAKLDRWQKEYLNETPEAKNKTRSSIRPKLIRQQAEWRIPALTEPLLTSDALFKLTPMTFEDKDKAVQNELLLNYQFNSAINKVAFVDGLIRKLVPEGTAIIRTGWEYEETVAEVEEPVWGYQPIQPAMPSAGSMGMPGMPAEQDPQAQQMQQLQQQYERAAQLRETHPDSYSNEVPEAVRKGLEASEQSGQLLIAFQTGVQKVSKPKVIKNRPTVELCNLHNVYIDPTCEGNFSRAQFVVYSFESTLAELKRDSRYINLDKLTERPFSAYADSDHNFAEHRSTEDFQDTPRKKLVVYEYWGYYDIDDSGLVEPIVATWVENTCIRMEKNPFPDGKPPFVVIPYIPIANSVYGEPDGELLADNQQILGAVTRGVIDLLGKSANSQMGVSKGLLDPTNKHKFMSGENYEFNPSNNPNTDIVFHKYPEIPNSALTLINLMKTDAEALSGIKGFNQGITGAGLGETAAGVRSAMDAASKREMSILRRIACGLVELCRKIMSMNFEFLSDEEVVRVTNEKFIKVRRDDLRGEFDLKVQISTAEEDEVKAKELAFMLQTIGNNMGMEMTKLILSEIARLRRMPDLAEEIKNFEQQPSEEQQKMQQLQMQLLEAQIELTRSQAQEAAAKSQVQGAKVGVEQARAQSLQGDADLKSQDFVRTQSGEKHAAELDKQGLDIEGKLEQQKIKSATALEQQLNQFGQDRVTQQNQHNSDLLKLYAQQALPLQNTGQGKVL